MKEETTSETIKRLRAESPFKKGTKRAARPKPPSLTIVNRKLNTERADCRAVEFQIKRTFGI